MIEYPKRLQPYDKVYLIKGRRDLCSMGSEMLVGSGGEEVREVRRKTANRKVDRKAFLAVWSPFLQSAALHCLPRHWMNVSALLILISRVSCNKSPPITAGDRTWIGRCISISMINNDMVRHGRAK